MLNLAVIGRDVSRSQSPAMHAFLLGKMGVACTYERVSLAPNEFRAQAEELFSRYDGFNVTIPFKRDILPYLGELVGDAATLSAVNTVVTVGRRGYNTDGFGFLLMLQTAEIEVRGKEVLVLGAGGAGRSCIRKLADSGARVSVYERDASRLGEVYAEFGCFTPLAEVPRKAYDVIVNCTGVGMHESEGRTPEIHFAGCGTCPADEKLLGGTGCAVDLIYEPEESEFLRIARECGRKTLSGGAMLFYQAYAADCIFTGKEPKIEEAKRFYREYREKL